jgi:hypothetical protein
MAPPFLTSALDAEWPYLGGKYPRYAFDRKFIGTQSRYGGC